MSDDKIAEIKERHFHDERWRNGPSMLCPQMHDDRAFLLAEVARQRAEIERLREALRDIERGDYSDPMCERTPEQRARDALEGKP